MPGGGASDDEEGYRRPKCKMLFRCSRRDSWDNTAIDQVPYDAFVCAARAMKKQITPDVIAKYERWRDHEGMIEA